MPTMQEIYERHALEYEELVAREDACGSVGRALEAVVRPGDRVLELGTGTGRVTRLYAGRASQVTCCDRSAHMLERAREGLAPLSERIRFSLADNDDLPDLGGPYDVIVEGWSFGHSAVAHGDRVAEWFEGLQARLLRFLAPGGRIAILETLGTMTREPHAPGPVLDEFYRLLERRFGYARTVLDTGYRFSDGTEAERILGFFFGPGLAARVEGPIVPEFTGLWRFDAPGPD